MSIARVTTVQKSRKPGKCEKCGIDLPVGSTYRHFKVGFRSRHVHKRCMASACSPKTSELESSMLSDVYAAMEDAEDQAGSVESVEDAQEILQVLADAIREVASAYEEASTNDDGVVFNTEAEERQQVLESAADDLESITLDDDTTADCEACGGTGKVTCEQCDGSGSETTDEADEPEECGACLGTGETDCDAEECNDGQVLDPDALQSALIDAINGVELP
jgi:hypothetical protein